MGATGTEPTVASNSFQGVERRDKAHKYAWRLLGIQSIFCEMPMSTIGIRGKIRDKPLFLLHLCFPHTESNLLMTTPCRSLGGEKSNAAKRLDAALRKRTIRAPVSEMIHPCLLCSS
jgi:hypothetical protein